MENVKRFLERLTNAAVVSCETHMRSICSKALCDRLLDFNKGCCAWKTQNKALKWGSRRSSRRRSEWKEPN